MAKETHDKKILVVGNQASLQKAGIPSDAEQNVEIVSSLAEAEAKQAAGEYARVIIDPDALGPSSFEVLPRTPFEVDGIAYATCSDTNTLFKAIFEVALNAVVIVDSEGRFVDANPAAGKFFGVERNGLIKKSLIDFIEPGVDIAKIWAEMVHYKRWRGDIRLVQPDGTVCDTQSYAVADALPGCNLFVFQDITDQQGTERSLRESVAREKVQIAEMKTVLDAVPILVWIAHDPECNVVTGNRVASELLGLPSHVNQIIGCGTNTADFVQKKNGHTLSADELPMRLAISTDAVIRDYEMDLEFEDGSIKHVMGNAAPLKDESGKIYGAVAAYLDLTYRRQIEAELVHAREEAEQQAAKMQSFVSGIVEGVAMLDTDGNIIFMNDAGKDILGGSSDKSFADWSHQYKYYTIDNEPMDARLTAPYRALRGETVKDQRYILETSWGRRVILSVSSAPIKHSDGSIIGVTSVFRDISGHVDLEKKQKELLEREQRITDALQKSLIPPAMPRSAGDFRFATLYQPALREAEVGGDFYDIFELGPNLLGILIADVAGKGLAAAITVASARYTIRSYAYLDPVPAKVMTLANETLSKSAGEEMHLLTAFFAVLDIQTGEMSYSNAGHEPPLACSCDGKIYELHTEGRSLGVEGNFIYTQARFHFKPGDRVIMVTDGITEARHDGKYLFGSEGVFNYLRENCCQDIEGVASGLYEAAKQHAEGRLQDDVAIIVIESKPE